MTNEEIVEYLEKVIAEGDKVLKDAGKDDFSLLYCDSDGMPFSYGNYDDCMSDGFDSGAEYGKYQLAQSLLYLIKTT